MIINIVLIIGFLISLIGAFLFCAGLVVASQPVADINYSGWLISPFAGGILGMIIGSVLVVVGLLAIFLSMRIANSNNS